MTTRQGNTYSMKNADEIVLRLLFFAGKNCAREWAELLELRNLKHSLISAANPDGSETRRGTRGERKRRRGEEKVGFIHTCLQVH